MSNFSNKLAKKKRNKKRHPNDGYTVAAPFPDMPLCADDKWADEKVFQYTEAYRKVVEKKKSSKGSKEEEYLACIFPACQGADHSRYSTHLEKDHNLKLKKSSNCVSAAHYVRSFFNDFHQSHIARQFSQIQIDAHETGIKPEIWLIIASRMGTFVTFENDELRNKWRARTLEYEKEIHKTIEKQRNGELRPTSSQASDTSLPSSSQSSVASSTIECSQDSGNGVDISASETDDVSTWKAFFRRVSEKHTLMMHAPLRANPTPKINHSNAVLNKDWSDFFKSRHELFK